MKNTSKNIKVSENHHQMLKEYCDKNGLKIYKVVQKWIDELCKTNKGVDTPKRKDIYGD